MPATVERAAVDFESVVPHLAVPDVVRAAKYYRDILGFEIAGYWDGKEVHRDPARTAVFGIIRRGEATIHLKLGDQSGLKAQTSDGFDLYFNVINLTALAEELQGRGAEIIEGPEDRIYGQRELVVRDCNGFVLAFGEPAVG